MARSTPTPFVRFSKTSRAALVVVQQLFRNQQSPAIRQPLTEQQRDGLEIIERSGEHLLNLVNDLDDTVATVAGRRNILPA